MAIQIVPGKTHIYTLVDPRTNIVRYVGKSIDPVARLQGHLNFQKPRTHKENWLYQLRILGLLPELVIIELVDNTLASSREIFWIADYRAKGFKLTNATDGGDGTVGYIHTPEQRRKLSLRLMGTKYALGHKVSPEARARISSSLKALGLVNPFQGKKHTPETKEKIASFHRGNTYRRGKAASSETRAKISAAGIGRVRSPETKAKHSETLRKVLALKTPEERSQMAYKSWESRRSNMAVQ